MKGWQLLYDPVYCERDRVRFDELSMAERRKWEKCLGRCLYLAWSPDDPTDATAGQTELEQLSRLLRLDHDLMGKFAVEQVQYWMARMYRMVRWTTQKRTGLLANTDKGRLVTLEEKTFAQTIAKHGWIIIIAEQSRDVETLSAHTMNCPWTFPPLRFRTFVDFANLFGFRWVDDRDKSTKTSSTIFRCM